MHQCAPAVAPDTLQAIIRTESGFDPLALHVNGKFRLNSPPRTLSEAVSWSGWLIEKGYSVDMGLMQINSRNLVRLNMTPAGAFDPCQNIRAGATLLTQDYQRAAALHGGGTRALLYAISAYNTGNFQAGLRNGYVAQVALNTAAHARNVPLDLTCLLRECSAGSMSPSRRIQPAMADTAIAGFGSDR
jgi:type IV secretion system protein VirB1